MSVVFRQIDVNRPLERSIWCTRLPLHAKGPHKVFAVNEIEALHCIKFLQM